MTVAIADFCWSCDHCGSPRGVSGLRNDLVGGSRSPV